jgi:U32 family peptidase
MKSKYKLLAPVGSFPMLQAAINAGADEVYLGLKEFSMRANAKNFTIKDLDKIQEICKPKKIKVNLTLNTIIYDNEIKKIEKLIKNVKSKIDAIICWDLSVIQLCKRYKIPFHISTQASISNSKTAKFYKKLGAKRLILARELSLKQIKEISKIKGIELEAFVHGAMCVAVSGRCFTSQFLFNKSANRGQCIHPCRRSYEIKDKQQGYQLTIQNNKVMSAKDLCTLSFIENMKKAGIKVFKIEGRNRDPRYVDVVTKIYKKALTKKLTQSELKQSFGELKKVYNREFSSGFYLGQPTPKDFASVEHSAAKEKKHFIGKINHYFSNIGVATIKLNSSVKLNDKIVIIGNTTGIIPSKIDSIQIKHQSVKSAKKGQEIGIKIPCFVRRNDEVYVLKKVKK